MRDRAPPKYAGIHTRALAGTASPRMAIRAMCLQCVSYDVAEVRACQITDCPLHKYRPYAVEVADSGTSGASQDQAATTLPA
ncbi:MAG: hypothetical protein GEV05_27410 [Betaproteobacteria bacterium]|nr:hypothetical protein [Betaproteobacteria bacterium]